MEAVAQDRWEIRCEWGQRGLAALANLSDVVVIVDVLSFSTCVDIAVSRNALIFPFTWRDERATEFAQAIGAALAGPRGKAPFSLSPSSFLDISPGTRVVLPSANGATLSHGAGRARVLAGCLRNAVAVAQAAQAMGKRVLVLPAGERWSDGTLRPCVEDWLGAGAIVDALAGSCSAEAEAARATFRAVRTDLARVLRDCTSGQELIERGYGDDVSLAAALNVSEAVPILREAAYHPLDPVQVEHLV